MAILLHIWTAVLYILASCALLWPVKRWIVPLSRRATLVLVLLPLCFTGKALLGGLVYAPLDLAYRSQPLAAHKADFGIDGISNGILSDVHCQNIPGRKAVRYAMTHGEWPLWNPFAHCGEPLLGSAQSAPFFLLTLLSLLLPLASSFTLTASLQYFLAGLGAYLYARSLDCRESVAFLAAAGWMFSSFVVFWSGWSMGATVALFPLILFGVRHIVAHPGFGSCLFLGLGLSQLAHAGHPESFLHIVMVAALAGVFELVHCPRGEWLRVLTWTGLSGVIALGLAALFLLPVLEALPQTYQWQLRRSGHQAIMHRAVSPGEAVEAVLANFYPFRHGFTALGEVSDKPAHVIPLSSAYAGTVLLAPALFGLWRSPWRGRFLLALMGGLGIVAGAKMPGVFPLLGTIPGFDMSLNQRLVFLAALAFPMLAALGVEAALREDRQSTLARLAAVVLVLYLGGLALLVPRMIDGGLGGSFVVGNALLAVAPLAFTVVLWGWVKSPRLLLALLVGTLLVQRSAEMGWFYPSLPQQAFYPRVRPLNKLPEAEGPYRVVAHGNVFLPNDATLYELEDARGYGAIEHLRFVETWPLWAERVPMWFLRIPDLNRPFLSFLNVRYALVGRGRRTRRPWIRVGVGRHVKLWRNRRALERAFIPTRVRLGASKEDTLAAMAEVEDFSRLAWIDDGRPKSGPGTEQANGPGEVRIRRLGTGYQLETDMVKPGWVVISTTAWNGWRAIGGEQDWPVAVANHAFLAVAVPAGKEEMELSYRPRAFDLGLGITGSTVAGLVLVVTGYQLRRRVRRSGPIVRAHG